MDELLSHANAVHNANAAVQQLADTDSPIMLQVDITSTNGLPKVRLSYNGNLLTIRDMLDDSIVALDKDQLLQLLSVVDTVETILLDTDETE